jgi:F-type H+-transporting ATPase subunit delta
MTAKQVAQKAKKLFRLCLASGRLDEDRARRVVQKIVAGRRRGYSRVLRQFGRLLHMEREQHSATVEFAVSPSPDIESSVRQRIESLYGPGIATVFTVDPHLIGGMRIRVGSDVYDGTVLNGLTTLEKSFGVASTNETR